MNANKFLNQSKPYAASFMGPALSAFNSSKSFKKMRKLVSGYTCTRVTDDNYSTSINGANGDCDFAFKCGFKRIRQEVEDDLLPHLTIDINRCGQWPAID